MAHEQAAAVRDAARREGEADAREVLVAAHAEHERLRAAAAEEVAAHEAAQTQIEAARAQVERELGEARGAAARECG